MDNQMSDYTPTTEEVRNGYSIADGGLNDTWLREDAENRFDLWFAEVKAQAVHDFVDSAIKPEKIMEVAAAGYNESVREVMAQAWDRGYEAGLTDFASSMTTNPYRQGETE